MDELLKRCAAIAALCAGCACLNGCLITNVVSGSNGGLTTFQATATLQNPSPCTVNTAANTTECRPTMTIGSPPFAQTYNFDITLLNYASPLPLYDPVIVEVPASMGNFAGSIASGPPGTVGMPLSIQAGLQTIAIDANTNLVAEPGTQLVIIDVPGNLPYPGTYTFTFQFTGTASAIKVIFAGKVSVGANVTYYPPIFPCVTSMAQVPAIPLPTNVANVLQILLSQQGCVGKQYNLTAPVGGTIDVNQQGLTGSWYNSATSGQGIELEFFVDAVAPGTAYLQGAWFTFDVASGGADHQRWYTFSGNAKTTAAHAGGGVAAQAGGGVAIPVTIYQNTGGNFDTAPVTNAVPVGTGTLTINDCTDGSFSYNFTDGSGRTGSLPLTRLTKNVACVTSGTPTPNADFGYTGNWYDQLTSGQGLVFELNPDSAILFFTWYTYAPNGQGAGASGQRWYTGQSNGFTPGQRTIAATLYETTGGLFNTGSPMPMTVPVGTATVTFASCGSATLNYNFTSGSNAGHTGSIPLSRVGPTPAGCGP